MELSHERPQPVADHRCAKNQSKVQNSVRMDAAGFAHNFVGDFSDFTVTAAAWPDLCGGAIRRIPTMSQPK